MIRRSYRDPIFGHIISFYIPSIERGLGWPAASSWYRLIFRLVFRRMDAERAHDFSLGVLRVVAWLPWIRTLLRRVTGGDDPRLAIHALGRTYPNPIGVAAGMDKTALSYRGLWALGFGHVEVGAITADEQTGATDTRLFRLPADHAVINRMGFPNPGAAVAGQRLRHEGEPVLVGVNVGKSEKIALEEAGDDYRKTVRQVAPVSDYVVINVSSPNTPGLRDMQAIGLLRPLVADVRAELAGAGITVPLLIKVSPDLDDDDLDSVADLALELELDGIVAVNTTTDRSGLKNSSPEKAALLPGGGISGAPLKARSFEVLRRLRQRVGDRVVLVSVGGVENAGDVWERILAGASLVQTHTGFMYGGPAWPWRVNREIARRVRAAGCTSIQELIGAADTVALNGTQPNGRHGPDDLARLSQLGAAASR